MTSTFSDITLDLRRRLAEIVDLRSVNYLLHWDMTTYMPPGGAEARARQLALLESLAHARAIDPELGRVLETAEEAFSREHSGASAAELPDNNDAALLRLARRQYDLARKVPQDFAATAAEHISRSYSVWAPARGRNDFAAVKPYLEKTLDLSRQFAGFYDDHEHPADPFIGQTDYGFSVAQIRPLFQELGRRLSPLVKSISQQPKPRHDFLHRHYPAAQQMAFGEKIARRIGYDYQRGRLDTTPHPFMTKFAHGDVRITTRVNENDLGDCLFSVMHEVGHALYEQGMDPDFDGTPLSDGTSNGVHESQSRLWENLVGRSRNFWELAYPDCQAAFPEQLGNVSVDEFYRAINLVTPSLIRTDADEVTYNLHVIIRFELECQMLEGSLSIDDLPDAWDAAYEDSLGLRAPSHVDGVLQDVHWYGGFIGGAFQGYALGNIMSCQIFEAALEENPNLDAHIRRGELTPLLQWLQNNIYRHGSKYTTKELLERVTGSDITLEPYFRYLQRKYGDLYQFEDNSGA